ncbi:ImmA/IrrE family metallo-endopeptidase [Kribbella sp. NPDC055071]
MTDTVGPPIHFPRRTTGPDVARGLWDALADEVSRDKYTLEVRATGDASEGFTDYDDRRIVVADHLDDAVAVRRLAHEVAHTRLHATEAGTPTRAIREVEAESVAYILLAHHGIGAGESSFDYVARWAGSVDAAQLADVVTATGARVVNAARQLLDATTTHIEVNRAPLPPVAARPLDSVFLAPDGPDL